MSEYYLADQKATERARQRESKPEPRAREAQDVKVQLVGDFVSTSAEPAGCDPYNSTQGKSARDMWRVRRDRR